MFTCALPVKAVPEMTYTVSVGMLNQTHFLTVSAFYLSLIEMVALYDELIHSAVEHLSSTSFW